MKTININQPIMDFSGKTPVAIINNVPMTIRDCLMNAVGAYQAPDGKKAIEAHALGLKICACTEGDLTLEDAEHKFLGEIVKANPARMPVITYAPVVSLVNGEL